MYIYMVSFTNTHVSGSQAMQCTGQEACGQENPCSHSRCSFGSTAKGQAHPGSMQVQQQESTDEY